MKKIFSLLAVSAMLVVTGCEEKPVPDPVGTNTVIMNWTITYPAWCPVDLYTGPDEDPSASFSYVQLRCGIWDASLNLVFFAIQSANPSFDSYVSTLHHGGEMVNMGEVNGLGEVTTIPTSGWSSSSATEVGHGYVLRFKRSYSYTNTSLSYYYFRMYVVEWLTGTNGSILGAKVKYQGPF